MTDQTDDQPDARVYNFPQIGFRLAPTTTLTDPPPAADADVPPRPDFPPTTPSPAGPGRRGRRSPLDTLAALPDPGLTAPLLPVPAASPAPAAGHVPDTFHGDDNQDGYAGARLGALSLAACLAVAVAALRGTHTFLTDRRQRRLATEAENAKIREARLKMRLAADEARGKHVLAMQGLQSKQAQQRAKQRVQSGPEFGRKSLGRSGSGSGGSGKSSGGRGRGGGAGSSGGSSAGRKKPKTGGGLFGGGSGGSSKKNSNRRGPNNGSGSGGGLKQKKPRNVLEPKKSPRRNSQSGSKAAQDKQRRKQLGGGKGNSGAGGPGLGAALKKDTQKAAARRWKKRQKRGPDNPALWGNSPKNQKNAPKNSPKNSLGPAGKNTPNAKNRKARKIQAQAAGANRRKLNQALWHDWKKAAGRRWKKRKTGPVPPIWKDRGHRKNKPGPQQAAPGGPAGTNTAPKTPKPNLKKNKQGGQQHAGRWAKAQAWARKKAAKGDFFGGTGPDPQQAAHGPGQAPGASGGSANAGQSGQDGQAGAPGGNRKRRSPFENAGQAAGQATGGAYTVERDDYVGAQAKQWEPDAINTGQAALPATGPAALDAATTTNPPRPGTTRPRKPIPMPQASRDTHAVIAQARKDAARTANHLTQGRQMDAQHATEITLDDAIDEYGDFKDDAFKTHDQCHKLAARAIKLREVLLAFAEDLAVNHNLIGPLFSGAMARMAESMDLVARMAEEMQTSSLQAAEMAETADNDLNDAYRPYNVATADAGLTTPSAPIHNQA
jgi:hypothetical protein